MAEYIDKEMALSLVQPDAPEDEKAPLQSQLPKNSSGVLYIAHLLPMLHQ